MGAASSFCRSQRRQPAHASAQSSSTSIFAVPPQLCSFCLRRRTEVDSACARCQLARYCSLACQSAHAPRHQAECSALASAPLLDSIQWNRLPPEMILHIFQFLDAADLLQLDRTSREVRQFAASDSIWRTLLPLDVRTSNSARDTYIQAASSFRLLLRAGSRTSGHLLYARGRPALVFSVTAFDVAWNQREHPFWSLFHDDNSLFDHCLHLNFASWLHGSGSCDSIPRGRHAVHLLVKSSRRTYLDNVQLLMSPSPGHEHAGTSCQSIMPDSWLRSGGASGVSEFQWISFRVGEITVDAPTADYTFQFKNTSGSSKMDCSFDAVIVTPI